MQFKAGDKCVLTVPAHLSADARAYIQHAWRQFAGDVPVLICDGGIELHVIEGIPGEVPHP